MMGKAIKFVVVAAIVVAAFFAVQNRQKAQVNNKAVALMDAGRASEAVTLLERALEADPDNAVIRQNLEEARTQAGKTAPDSDVDEEGLESRAAARVERMKRDGWQNDNASLDDTLATAETMFQMGDLKSAVLLLERALFKDPTNLDIERRIERIENEIGQTL